MPSLFVIPKAPTSVKEENRMSKCECPCGYVYDEQAGDPEHGLAPGTRWEDVPEDFLCPVCGLGKDAFSEI